MDLSSRRQPGNAADTGVPARIHGQSRAAKRLITSLRLTAHGIYEAELNEKPVTENKFKPGLTSYFFHTQVQEHDITDFVSTNDNELRVTVGDGWRCLHVTKCKGTTYYLNTQHTSMHL